MERKANCGEKFFIVGKDLNRWEMIEGNYCFFFYLRVSAVAKPPRVLLFRSIIEICSPNVHSNASHWLELISLLKSIATFRHEPGQLRIIDPGFHWLFGLVRCPHAMYISKYIKKNQYIEGTSFQYEILDPVGVSCWNY